MALLSTGLKWYINVVLDLIQERPVPARYALGNVLGFVPTMSCQQITAPLMIVLAKAFEWPLDEPAHLFCGDVRAAFDNIHAEDSVWAMHRRGVPAQLIAALVRESAGSQMEAVFQVLGCTEAFRVGDGDLWQG